MAQPSKPETFSNVTPIETFSNVTPIGDSPQPSVWDVLTQPTEKTDQEYLDYKGAAGVAGATAKGLNDVARGTRGAISGIWDTIRHPVDTAKGIAALPSQAAQVPAAVRDINASPDPATSYLNAAQDTASQGAGQALTALGTAAIPKAVPPLIRGVAKGTNKVLSTAPGTIGGMVGATAGHATGLTGAAELGAGIGYGVGREILPKLRVPGENFGLPKPGVIADTMRQSKALASVPTPETAPAAQTGEALGELPQRGGYAKAMEQPEAATADSGKQFARKSLQKMLGEQLEKGLGAERLDPKAPIAARPRPTDPLSSDLPEGHTAHQSSAVRSSMYDAGAREFHARYSSAGDTSHVFGDVSPEEAQAFEQAESKGKALQAIKQNHPLVAKIVNGKRVPIKPPGRGAISDSFSSGQKLTQPEAQ